MKISRYLIDAISYVSSDYDALIYLIGARSKSLVFLETEVLSIYNYTFLLLIHRFISVSVD